ncbi:hypothetical protein EC973_003724 [Apophysomyces ossiformis]|uniref:Uncharacterized protein n=1 Tax=Apophysomyces ossiformis TaxID=679940 RepID=A0A8H7EMX4_9FUNG|nr:hypothetical protein EC973_003724 [Apophysomyces ossiformis]
MQADKTYKYTYNGDNIDLLYFSNHPVEAWSLDSFESFIVKREPIKSQAVVSRFLRALDIIDKDRQVSTDVKKSVNILKKMVKNTDHSDRANRHTNNFTTNISHASTVINAGNGNSITLNDLQQQEQQEEGQNEQQHTQQLQEFDRQKDGEKPTKKRRIIQDDMQDHEIVDEGNDGSEYSLAYTEEDIWSEWMEFLQQAKDDESIHIYSPWRHSVILCGKGISPNPRINRELNHLKGYIDSVIDSESLDNMERILDTVAIISGHEATFRFVRSIFTTMHNVYLRLPSLSYSESVFNANLIWPCLNACVKFVKEHHNKNCDPYFVPGEESSNAVTTQLQRIGAKYDDRYKYNADGVIRLRGLLETEIMIVETSGSFDKRDKTKISFDLHKGMFGLLSMLKTIADKYEYASIESFKELKMKLTSCIDQLATLSSEHKQKKRLLRYEAVDKSTLLSSIVNPTILRLSQNYDSKGLAEELPCSSPGYYDSDFLYS